MNVVVVVVEQCKLRQTSLDRARSIDWKAVGILKDIDDNNVRRSGR